MSALTTRETRGWSAVMASTHCLSTAITSSHSPSTFVNIALVSCGRPDARTIRTASATAAAYEPLSSGPAGAMLNAAIIGGASAVAALVARGAGRHVGQPVAPGRLERDGPVHLAALGQRLQRAHRHRRTVDVEVAPRSRTGVGEAEPVGAERGEGARHPLADLVLDGPHVVGDRDDRPGATRELLGDPRHRRLGLRAQEGGLVAAQPVATQLVPRRHG